jgi:Phosphopantetheine attachment site/AMP-binding enzyme C-terminal domain
MSPEHERLHALWRERSPARETALVAFVRPRDQAVLDADELRNWLAQALPAALLPARVVVCDTLPRTASGKVDRAALRLPADVPVPNRAAVAPRNALEQRLQELFGQVLGLAPTSVEDDFFAHLGGHSLLATQLASLIRQAWPIEFELRTVFERPTVAGLAASIEQALLAAPASGQTSSSQPIPRRPQAASTASAQPTALPPARRDGTAA